MSVKTGETGTNSNVFVSLYGNKSAIESIGLNEQVSKRKKNLFEKATLDEFEFEANDVGKVSNVLKRILSKTLFYICVF